jgi:hypothetical protein
MPMPRRGEAQRVIAALLYVLAGGVAAGLFVLVAWTVWEVPQALYSYVPDAKDRADVEASTRTGVIAGLAGFAALGSLAVTTRTFRLTQQGQLTERYTKAIAQLGNDKLEVRLGGIYALERIAVDSKRDHPTVVEVLSAYVRERSGPIELIRPSPRQRTADPRALHKQVKLRVDTQAALTVLGRLPERAGVSRTDLIGANLADASLRMANLTWAKLGGANLSGAELWRANLSGAELMEAALSGAELMEANLSGAELWRANLSGAELWEANLTKASLRRANLTGADLREANLTEARLDGVDLSGVLGLTQEQLNRASGSSETKLPPGLHRPESWPVLKDRSPADTPMRTA